MLSSQPPQSAIPKLAILKMASSGTITLWGYIKEMSSVKGIKMSSDM